MVQAWDPIVVDIPTMPFEPRPPVPRTYLPDTICDGWSTKDIVVRLAAVRGYSHRYGDLPRQDAAQARIHPRTGTVVFAVADGVSSAPRSDVGANTACDVVVPALLKALDVDRDGVNWANVLRYSARTMIARCGDDPHRVEAQFATTLVAGVVAPDGAGGLRATIVQIGDSSAWILHNGQYRSALHNKLDGGGATISSEVTPFPRVPEPVVPVEVDVPADAVLLVGTDGFGDPLGDGTGLVGQLFAEALRDIPPPLGFAHTLDFSRETFDDDRALVAVWPRSGPDAMR